MFKKQTLCEDNSKFQPQQTFPTIIEFEEASLLTCWIHKMLQYSTRTRAVLPTVIGRKRNHYIGIHDLNKSLRFDTDKVENCKG